MTVYVSIQRTLITPRRSLRERDDARRMMSLIGCTEALSVSAFALVIFVQITYDNAEEPMIIISTSMISITIFFIVHMFDKSNVLSKIIF